MGWIMKEHRKRAVKNITPKTMTSFLLGTSCYLLSLLGWRASGANHSHDDHCQHCDDTNGDHDDHKQVAVLLRSDAAVWRVHLSNWRLWERTGKWSSGLGGCGRSVYQALLGCTKFLMFWAFLNLRVMMGVWETQWKYERKRLHYLHKINENLYLHKILIDKYS